MPAPSVKQTLPNGPVSSVKQTNAPSPKPAVKPEPPPQPEKRSLADRVKDIETRWGKSLDEVVVDLHDHVFGTSVPHETAAPQPVEDGV